MLAFWRTAASRMAWKVYPHPSTLRVLSIIVWMAASSSLGMKSLIASLSLGGSSRLATIGISSSSASWRVFSLFPNARNNLWSLVLTRTVSDLRCSA